MNTLPLIFIAAGVLLCLWVVLAFALTLRDVWTDRRRWDRE